MDNFPQCQEIDITFVMSPCKGKHVITGALTRKVEMSSANAPPFLRLLSVEQAQMICEAKDTVFRRLDATTDLR